MSIVIYVMDNEQKELGELDIEKSGMNIRGTEESSRNKYMEVK